MNSAPSKFRGLFFVATMAASTALLSACSNDSTEPPKPTQLTFESMPDEAPDTTIPGPLGKSAQVSAKQFVLNGIYYSTLANNADFPSPALAENSFSSANGNTFSVTNVQEQGVDEADRIKYNGQFMYLANYPIWDQDGEVASGVRVLSRQQDYSLEQSKHIDASDSAYDHVELYLTPDRLASLNSNRYGIAAAATSILPQQPSGFRLNVFDTSDPMQAQVLSELSFEGNLVDSRRVDDNLYIVSSHIATVNNLTYSAQSDADKRANFSAINSLSEEEIAPAYHARGGAPQALFLLDECLIPESAKATDGFSGMVAITRINLAVPSDMNSLCIAASVQNIYSAVHNLYLYDTYNDNTLLHKISLGSTPVYQASGEIEGVLGWQQNASLRLSEQESLLRAVTSQRLSDEIRHSLKIVEQNGNQLEVIAQIPNEQQTTPIGKPGEDIFAVRFIDERAYIVTFERIDPLYVIDLSTPRSPQIAGSIEIPGFSSYLHPMGDNFLLGVGQNVLSEDFPDNGTEPTRPVTTTGMKVSLFDVSDPAFPIEVSSITRDNSYTPVEFDYRALAALHTDGGYQFAMPIEFWGEPDGFGIWQPSNSLLLMQVNTTTNDASLELIKEISAPKSTQGYVYGGSDRAVIHDEHVYYIHGNQVWRTTWSTDAEVSGPY